MEKYLKWLYKENTGFLGTIGRFFAGYISLPVIVLYRIYQGLKIVWGARKGISKFAMYATAAISCIGFGIWIVSGITAALAAPLTGGSLLLVLILVSAIRV